MMLEGSPRRSLVVDVRDRCLARSQVLLGVAGPAVIAGLLPPAGDLLRGVSDGTDPIEVLGSAMLLAVAIVAWGLLGWAALVAIATALTRMPGGAGRAGRTLLRAVAPAATRRILVVATGVSLIAGASACGTAAASASPQASGPAVVAAATAAVTVPATAPASPAAARTTGPAYRDGGYAGPGAQIDLDWPVSESAAIPGSGPSAATARPRAAGGAAAATTASGPAASATPASGPAATPSTRAPSSGAPSSAAPNAAPSSATPSSGPQRSGTGTPAPAPARPTPETTAPGAPKPLPAPPASDAPLAPSHGPTSPHRPDPVRRPASPPAQHLVTAGPGAPAGSATPGGQPAPEDHHGTVVTVRPGDSLWTIAARHLPAGATDAQIDAAWRSWYAANRAAIGADPNLIIPGRHLISPDTEGNS